MLNGISGVRYTSPISPSEIGMKMRTSDQLTICVAAVFCLETLDLKAPVNGMGRFELIVVLVSSF